MHSISVVQYKYLFGYCPQNDALLGYMTAYEMLKYISMIRGKDSSMLYRIMADTDLLQYKDVSCGRYSGGTKRKLNTAMAIVSARFNFQIYKFVIIIII